VKSRASILLAAFTSVIFTTDQLSRGKWTCYQSVRIPVAIRWPGKVKPGVNKTLLSGMDIAPTLMDLIGGKLPMSNEAILDGQSFAPILTDKTVAERPLLVEMGYARAIISGGWKYIATRLPEAIQADAAEKHKTPNLLGRYSTDKEQVPIGLWPSFGSKDELFHLAADPMEQINLATDPTHAEKLGEMRELLKTALQPLPHPFAEFRK
jgi:N-sulfoglucosamine sulfohydrolase